VKIYDVATYEVVHNIDYPGPILSLAVSVSSSFRCFCRLFLHSVTRRFAFNQRGKSFGQESPKPRFASKLESIWTVIFLQQKTIRSRFINLASLNLI